MYAAIWKILGGALLCVASLCNPVASAQENSFSVLLSGGQYASSIDGERFSYSLGGVEVTGSYQVAGPVGVFASGAVFIPDNAADDALSLFGTSGLRFNVLPGQPVNPYFQAGVTIQTIEVNDQVLIGGNYEDISTGSTSVGVGGGPGILYQAGRGVALDASFSLIRANSSDDNSSTFLRLGFGFAYRPQ